MDLAVPAIPLHYVDGFGHGQGYKAPNSFRLSIFGSMKTCFLFLLLLVTGFSCKPASPTQEQKPEASQPVQADSSESMIDTTTAAVTVEDGKYEAPKTTPRITDHQCDPNFTQLSKPIGQNHFYYVTGFDPREFKCWNELEKHGEKISNERPCVIYYIDIADAKINASGPAYLDAETLLKHGIARFEYSGKFWELKGARTWKRKDKGFEYYNTNNQFGG